MTVQEAKESIEYLKMQLEEDLEMICFTGDELKAIDIAIESMEKVEQYRALGIVEELKAEGGNVKGVCYEVSYDEYLFDLNVDLELVMVCSVSLLDVLVPLQFNTKVRFTNSIDDSSDDYLITKDTINLDEALLSEIVLELPLKVVKEGYENEFMEEEEETEEDIDPRLKALKELYGGEAE